MQHWVEMIFQCMQLNGQRIPDIRVSPSRWRGTGGAPTHYPKNWLVPPHVPPLLFCPKNVDFVIYVQFLAILPKLSPHKSNKFGKPWISEKRKFKPCHCSCVEIMPLPRDLANTYNSKLEQANCLLQKFQIYLMDNA